MSDLASTGQDAPAVTSEATPPATAPAAQAGTAETPAEGTAPAAEEQEPVAPKTYSEEEVQERIERATAKAAAKAERRAFREASQIMQRQQQPVQQPVDDKPRRDQFASEDEFVDKLTDWKLDQRDKSANQQRQQAQATATNAKTENLYKEAEKIPGFDRDAFEELPLTPVIAQALIESDAPAKLMAFMASNPEEVDRISTLSPARQAAEIGKLEAKLATAPPVKTTKTPAPINPVGGGTGATGTTVHNAKTMEDFMAIMKKNGSRWVR
jgi:hypothetical protein